MDHSETNHATYSSRRSRCARALIRFRIPLLCVTHLVAFFFAYWLAFLLRFDFAIPAFWWQTMLATFPVVSMIKLATFSISGTLHGWWRYVTFSDILPIARATIWSSLLVTFVDYFFLPAQIPRSVVAIDMMSTGVLLVALRSSWRLLREGIWRRAKLAKGGKAVLFVSDHYENLVLAHQINESPVQRHRIVGILSYDRSIIGSTRAGIPIVGHPDDAVSEASAWGAAEIWVVAGAISGVELRKLRTSLENSGLQIKVIPAALSMGRDNGEIPLRDIEINDLLQRDPVSLDPTQISKDLRGRRVLITGAGGSIGSEICRQVIRFLPADLILIDHRENSVFLIHEELSRLKPDETTLHPCVGDVLDQERMRKLFETYEPEIVFHAAAHKHVGLMEVNASEAVKNNVFGTKAVADLADEFHVKKFVLISTDKAVNPTSVMGATKHLAERYVHALAQSSQTAFLVVRFGNVLGSNGSVVPIFKEQIARGGPITITDPRMTRFFMTIPEASQLVLQAASMGQGGEIFVLEMGDQVSILQLAKEMIRLTGLPEGAIEIEYIGMRPGEKLHEELYFDEERMLNTDHPKVRAAQHRPCSLADANKMLERFRDVNQCSNDTVRQRLKELIPEFELAAAPPTASPSPN